MLIHYIWIKEFRQLKEKGINLSSKYFFSFEPESIDLTVKGILTIKRNPNYISNFFEKSEIKEVSAIIGKNGSGKSTIIEYIKSHFPEGVEANMSTDMVCYSLFDADYKEYGWQVVYPDGWEIELKDETGLFTTECYGGLLSTKDAFRFVTDLSSADYIYYSYNLNYNQDLTDWHGLKNISTSAFLTSERKRFIEERWKSGEIEPIEAITDDLTFLARLETSMALQLLISDYKKILPFTPPDSLTISITKFDRNYFKTDKKEDKDILEIISQLDKLAEANPNDISKSKDKLYLAMFINHMVMEKKYSTFSPYQADLGGMVNVQGFVRYAFRTLNYEKHKGFRFSVDARNFFDLIDRMMDDGKLIPQKWGDLGDYIYKLPINIDAASMFNEFMELYIRVKGFTNFLNFDWRGLSTGEQSFLSLVSRFFHIKRHAIGNDDLKNNLVIMIDEGDVGYHPEWQRTFFKKSIDFLSTLFSDHSLQLIFTANAPFITSDLPKDNITFIEKKEDETIIVWGKENNRSETFGSNIHTLYTDSFYMEGALIGAFAKDKIDKIIKYLNSEAAEPIDEYRATIDKIGEPILRRKLQSMWIEKFGDAEELKALENRIAELRKKSS